jgi:excisionase family DNA binding protein
MTYLLTAKEAAERLRIVVGTIYNYVHAGKLTPVKRFNGWSPRFRVEDVDALLEDKIRERAPRQRSAPCGPQNE